MATVQYSRRILDTRRDLSRIVQAVHACVHAVPGGSTVCTHMYMYLLSLSMCSERYCTGYFVLYIVYTSLHDHWVGIPRSTSQSSRILGSVYTVFKFIVRYYPVHYYYSMYSNTIDKGGPRSTSTVLTLHVCEGKRNVTCKWLPSQPNGTTVWRIVALAGQESQCPESRRNS